MTEHAVLCGHNMRGRLTCRIGAVVTHTAIGEDALMGEG